MATIYNPYEDWGYKFTGGAIESFIRELEGETALENYPEFRDRRDRAEQLMSDLFGQTPYLFYVRRIEQGHNLGEQKWELILATDLDNLKLPTLFEERGSTLKLVAIVNNDGSGGLRIIYARLRSKREGTKDSFAKSFYLRLRSNYRDRIGVPLQAIERMADTPFKQDCIPTEQQLEAWKVFVEVEERIAKEKQFCVPFVSHNYGEATRNITFAIDAESATVDSQTENSITLDDFWRRAKRARNQNIKLKENNSSNSDEIELGTIESIDSENNLLKISLDSEIFNFVAEGHYTLPQEGLLSFEAVGDVVQTRRKKQAIRNLERGRTQNPYLGQFLFDASQAKEAREIIQIQSQDLLLENINPSQKAAVETVLSAPDLALIQGPPGTGKTTVIAEICYQVALRGGRTLIASQANLAVDNALSRLQHNPVIRAVRKGNKNSVEQEGESFLEENVIKNWLQNTSADCEHRLNAKLELAKILRQLLASVEQFSAYLITEEKFQLKQEQLIAHQEILKVNYQNQLKAYEIAQGKQDQLESLSNNLTAILTSTSSINWDEPTVSSCLTQLPPYKDKDDSVEQLAINVREVTILAKEISLFLPEFDLFALAGWLYDNLPLKLAEAHLVLNRAENAETAMVEANSAWQTFQECSAEENKLRKEQQKISDTISNLERQIIYQKKDSGAFQNKEHEIRLIKNQLESFLDKVNRVNRDVLEAIDLLPYLQPYIDQESSAVELAENVAIAKKIAIDFSIHLPEYGLFSMTDWLHNNIREQLPLIQEVLDDAQNGALAMNEASSAAQILREKNNLIIQLKSDIKKIDEQQNNFQQELDSLDVTKNKINIAIDDLQHWFNTSHLKLYKAIQLRFQQKPRLTKDSIDLPSSVFKFFDNFNYKHLDSALCVANDQLNHLILKEAEWRIICKDSKFIYSVTNREKASSNIQQSNNNNFTNCIENFTIKIIYLYVYIKCVVLSSPMVALGKLKHYAIDISVISGNSFRKINYFDQKLNFLKYQVIKKICNKIIQKNPPIQLRHNLNRIINQTVKDIYNNNYKSLYENQEIIDEDIKSIKSKYDGLKYNKLQIKDRIRDAKQLANDLDANLREKNDRISTILRKIVKSPVLPKEFRLAIDLNQINQSLSSNSESYCILPYFQKSVNHHQYHFNRLKNIIPQLNYFIVINNINNTITQDLNIYKIINKKTIKQENISQKILNIKEHIKSNKEKLECKIHTVIQIWQEIRENTQPQSKLHTFSNKYLQNPNAFLTKESQLASLIETYESQIIQLESLIPQLNPFPVLSKIKSLIEVDLQQQQETTAKAFDQLQNFQDRLDETKAQIQQQINTLEEYRYWWQKYWQTIPNSLKPEEEFTDLFELNFLRRFKLQFEVWQQELGVTDAYLNRYQNLMSDWIKGLNNHSEQNRHELKRIYLDNSNVIGITCSQSAKGDFSREFKSFDVVIIDEVSKCTPPELLIPALKAKKLVLVGDHRQLPPMLNNDTVEEIAEELGTTTEELDYLKESLFKNLFESAPESIKKMLTIQYRMHPQIMRAINQFYEDNLECGLTNPDEQRSHNLVNSNIRGNNHIVWVKTPQQLEFREQKIGTSVVNEKEIEAIEKICQQFEQTWSVQVNKGQPRKEIGIITFYGHQLKLIESRIDPKKFPSLHIRTGTVDRFQGMERQVIIVSMVRNNNHKNLGFAKKPERVNVAFSRAQELLVIIGCHSLFTRLPVYSQVSDVVRLHGGLIDVFDIL